MISSRNQSWLKPNTKSSLFFVQRERRKHIQATKCVYFLTLRAVYCALLDSSSVPAQTTSKSALPKQSTLIRRALSPISIKVKNIGKVYISENPEVQSDTSSSPAFGKASKFNYQTHTDDSKHIHLDTGRNIAPKTFTTGLALSTKSKRDSILPGEKIQRIIISMIERQASSQEVFQHFSDLQRLDEHSILMA